MDVGTTEGRGERLTAAEYEARYGAKRGPIVVNNFGRAVHTGRVRFRPLTRLIGWTLDVARWLVAVLVVVLLALAILAAGRAILDVVS